MSFDDIAGAAFDQSQLNALGVGLIAVAMAWLVVAVSSLKALDSGRLPAATRLAGAVVVTLLATAIVAPLVFGAQYAWTQSQLIGSISQDSATDPALDEANPWENKPRVNVLLLGGDAGTRRTNLRVDSLVLASIDTQTGDTLLISVPRNLERVPFATGTPAGDALAAAFPDGFTNYAGGDLEYVLFAVYPNAASFVPEEAFADSDDPGADATKLAVAGALGIDVDYYVIADLQGFRDIVDAMGGITIDVNYPVPIGTKQDGGCTPARGWIEPGSDQHLDGEQALWFARARCSPGHPTFDYDAIGGDPVVDDYNRMERQRCVMGSLAERADPVELLPRFQALAAATEKNVRTDIPADLFPAFAQLGAKIKNATLSSITLDRDVIDSSDPDYDHLHDVVHEALNPPTETESSEPTAGAGETGEQAGPTEEPAEPDPEQPVDVAASC
jgi:LCP family protein required for cell wall assembly